MQYNQPFDQPGSPNASYVNGNPGTGTPGSIPPAAAFEQPQREIVNLITDTGLTPSGADLHQLGKGIQTGSLIYGVDTSTTVNQVVVTLTPAPSAYVAGFTMRVKMANDCTGPATVVANSLGTKAIVKKPGAQALVGGEWKAGDIVDLEFDGTNFQGVGLAVRAPLTAAVDIYVNPATGSDTACDGSAATVSGAHGPFATLTKALTIVAQFAPGTFGATIHLSSGTHDAGTSFFQTASWAHCNVTITGAGTSSTLLTTHSSTGNVTFSVQGPTQYTIQNMDVSHQGSAAGGFVIGCSALGAVLRVINIRFMGNSCSVGGFIGAGAGEVDLVGGTTITLGASCNGQYFYASGSGAIISFGPSVTIAAGGSAFSCVSGFVNAANAGLVGAINNPILSGTGSITGIKYNASLNGIINTGGAGINFWPGNSAGVTATGGQYA